MESRKGNQLLEARIGDNGAGARRVGSDLDEAVGGAQAYRRSQVHAVYNGKLAPLALRLWTG
jgi:hypothetical protein